MPHSFLHRNWRYAPRGDFESMCSICGVACARSKLRKKADALYYCPDCQPGRDAVTLSRLNSQYHPVYRRDPMDGGGFDGRDYGVTPSSGYPIIFGQEFSEEFG